MHFVQAKGILSANNGMNLCRGCLHGCIYCDSRSLCYHMDHAFEDIEIKENAAELFRDALDRKRRRCMIGTGSMTDPYISLPESRKLLREVLETADEKGFGFTLITKSADVLEDIDVLRRINEKAKCVVQMTLTTYDENLCRILEPHVSTTRQRFEALKVLRDNGIPTVVWLSPILPFINDTEDNMNGILEYCVEAGVYGIICFGMGLTLREGNREYFYRALDRHFPGMKERYIAAYGNSYEVMSPDNDRLMKLFHRRCRENGILCDNNAIFEYLNKLEDGQMSLF